MIKYTWDYNPPQGSPYQEDWNHTLISVLNRIYIENGFEGCLLVKTPIKFESLMSTLLYYREDRHMLGTNYYIEYRDVQSDIINVDGFELEILNYKEQI